MLRAQLLRERRMQEQEVALTYKIAQAVEWSEIDALTGCRNRAAFDTFLREVARRGNERTFSLIMMDIDHFKDVNDTYGHDMGDKVLIRFAELVRGHLEQDFDLVCSRCGETFDTTIKVDDFTASVEVSEKQDFADLTTDARESIILALPTYPLCDEDCPGIAQKVERPADDRWGALDGLKVD